MSNDTVILEKRIAALESQVRALTDQLEIYHAVATYGPAVDGIASAEAADLWTEDGVYDAQLGLWRGTEELCGMTQGELHNRLTSNGCGHVLTMPRVVVNGDTAVALNHSQLYEKSGDTFAVLRISANKWEFVRTDKGWKIKRRTLRVLDGSKDARDIFSDEFASR